MEGKKKDDEMIDQKMDEWMGKNRRCACMDGCIRSVNGNQTFSL